MELTRTDPGKDLIVFRIKNGFTQDQLSEKTGVSVPTIINIEKGKKEPQATTLYKLNLFIKTFKD